ncbi:MAG TPA: PEP-CTERM sorting domain-containing protein [Bryobacteraceae bacterium]|nr:PEP-CTERM sorting domain-containing protein [Bryobacteraceae bacterium]
MRLHSNRAKLGVSLWAALCLTLVGALPGSAAAVTDPSNDFVPTFDGPHNSDLDALSANVTLNGSSLDFTATLSGPIGQTPGAQYVFGLNRGKGMPLFANINEPNVLFDANFVLRPFGQSVTNDLIAKTATNVNTVSFSGSTINGVVPLSDLPSEGFSPNNYRVSFWPETTPDIPTNTNVSDFAPNNATAAITTTPEPGTLSLLGVAVAGAVAVLRRRKSALLSVG